MTNGRQDARKGKGAVASKAPAVVDGVGPVHKREFSISRLEVWKWWLEVFGEEEVTGGSGECGEGRNFSFHRRAGSSGRRASHGAWDWAAKYGFPDNRVQVGVPGHGGAGLTLNA